MNIYIKIIGISFVIDIILYFIRYRMYYNTLLLCKYTRTEVVSQIEKVLYFVQMLGTKIPYFILKPKSYTIENLQEEVGHTVWLFERLLIEFESVYYFVRQFIGIRIAYIICAFVYLYKMNYVLIQEMIAKIAEGIMNINFISFFQNVYGYIIKNGSGILVVTIIILLFYINYLKKKNNKYFFENIWQDDFLQKSKAVASAQKKIQEYIILLHKSLRKNIIELKKIIDKMDRRFKYNPEESIKYDLSQFDEYKNFIDEIKKEIEFIEKNDGLILYITYNKKIWSQLYQLSLTSSENKYYYAHNLSECDKESIKNVLNEEVNTANYKRVRSLLIMYWVDGISCFNGISRYLKYIKKRKYQFNKINSKLIRTNSLKQLLDDVKSNID